MTDDDTATTGTRPAPAAKKCRYCDNPATKTLIWLKDKQQRPARIKVPYCGCDLMAALRKTWANPYPVVEGVDYEIVALVDAPPVPPDCMSLEEFAETLEAARNAATWENLPDHGNRDGSAKLAAVTPEPPADILTPEQMIDAWRQLLKDGHFVRTTKDLGGWPYIEIIRIENGWYDHTYIGGDPDPLVAFTRAYRAFREGTAKP